MVSDRALFRLLPPAAILDEMNEIERFWVPSFRPRWPLGVTNEKAPQIVSNP